MVPTSRSVTLAALPFLFPLLAHAQEPFVLSRNSAQELANAASYDVSVSGDGRFCAFDSDATNLVAADANGRRDVFWRDRQFAVTACASVSSAGAPANDSSFAPSISANGTYVVFHSLASNLAPGDSNGTLDVYLRDTANGLTTLISASPAGQAGNLGSFDADVSADGRYVVFVTNASDLVSGDTNNRWDILLRDNPANTMTRVSQGGPGQEPNNNSYRPQISDDGQFICFTSDATNLVAGDVNGHRDVFLFEVQTGTIVSVTMNPSLLIGNGDSDSPRISATGDFVVFSSFASNLVPADTNNAWDIFRWRRASGGFYRASVSSSGLQGGSTCFLSSITADGKRIVFTSQASNLVPNDTNGVADVFVHDVNGGTTKRASVTVAGQQVYGVSDSPVVSADGSTVAFRCASSLVAGDTNGVPDIYAWGDACPGVDVYCTAKVNSNGCLPYMCSGGMPTLSGPDDFYITAFRVLNLKAGMFFWSSTPIFAPFGGGTRCVAYPVVRTGIQDSGGNIAVNDCSGTYSFFFSHAHMQVHGLVPGMHVYGQFWSRDPFFPMPQNIGLTDAVDIQILP